MACSSKHGPPDERVRHVLLLLAGAMFNGSDVGCYLSQRGLAPMIPCDHKTAGRSLRWLRENGWVDAQPRPSQYGRVGYTWKPAVPEAVLKEIGECMDPQCQHNKRRAMDALGSSSIPQSSAPSAPIGEPHDRNGELHAVIGELLPGIGEPRSAPESSPESLSQKDLNRTRVRDKVRTVRIGVAPPEPRSSLTLEQLDSAVSKLYALGYDTPGQIVHLVGSDRVTFEQASAALRSVAARTQAAVGAPLA